ncbi:putative leucine-rich repeat domain, L domain-containing protein [Rosa chinensis]|uniref:Putative leucine-rich repeat domain, L domain-containing protein n=1 Tax=Rosa chinensis TaxID=74649 RepID=A0A2P6SG65_ROSCH|nr:putative leucine-rich repeat domain, L domain-containing protein [Rosa chinensis]
MSSSCLHDCVSWLVNQKVEELVLKVGSSGGFDLPLCVFQCDSLRCLKLDAHISWFVSPSFLSGATNGLGSLHTLSLAHVDFLFNCLCKDLFTGSSFPCLESLTIQSCNGMTHLKISCPNLKVVHVNSMNINRLDISGMRLESLRVSFSFFRCDSESWVSVFAPNLKTFSWLANCITEKCLIHGFPALKTSHINCRCPDDLSVAKIHSAVNLVWASSQVQSLVISRDFLRVSCPSVSFFFFFLENLSVSV